MTTRRSYNCNLCHSSTNDGGGVGLKWRGMDKIEMTSVSSAETHVCTACLNGLLAAHHDLMEADRIRRDVDTARADQSRG